MADTDLMKPSYAHNMRLIGHCDQAGRADGQQIMVRNGYAYIGHVCSKGFSGDLIAQERVVVEEWIACRQAG